MKKEEMAARDAQIVEAIHKNTLRILEEIGFQRRRWICCAKTA